MEQCVALEQLREVIHGIEKMAHVMAKKGESFDEAEFRKANAKAKQMGTSSEGRDPTSNRSDPAVRSR